MRVLMLALVLVAAGLQSPIGGRHACAGALLAMQEFGQERRLPAGEWCQRAPTSTPKAHACSCHQHDCTDPDPEHVSAHTDPQCLVYCDVHNCRCEHQDCP